MQMQLIIVLIWHMTFQLNIRSVMKTEYRNLMVQTLRTSVIVALNEKNHYHYPARHGWGVDFVLGRNKEPLC